VEVTSNNTSFKLCIKRQHCIEQFGYLARTEPSLALPHPYREASEYHSTAPFVVGNPKMVKETKHNAMDGDPAKLVIMMTCFGRIEAYVPHGPDAEELIQLEKTFQEEMIHYGERDDETFDSAEWAHRTWLEPPRECVGDIQRKFIGKAVSDAEGRDTKMRRAYVTT
jgi:hypothetical protein